MKKIPYLAALVGVCAMSSPASAATLVDAWVTGQTGSGGVWDTEADDNWTLFLQDPGLGDFLNPNDEGISVPVTGLTDILLAGEGYFSGVAGESDSLYKLTLGFDEGFTLSGYYSPVGNVFSGGTSAVSNGMTYSLTEFSWDRYLGDSVQRFQAVPGGDGDDYAGNFVIDVNSAVPEPSTWAMLLIGFGLIGGFMRRRGAAPRLRLKAI